MPTKVQRYSTQKFTERAPLIALGALGLIAIALIASAAFSRQLLQKSVPVSAGNTVKLAPVQPRQSPIGAVRIDATARLPDNAWSTFEVQILDSQGNLLASAVKQAWRESGTWSEEGETGTWSEQDLEGRLDIRRATLEQPIVVAISVLEQGKTSGQPLDTPVNFRVTIWDGSVDRRFLWSGLVGVLILTMMTQNAVSKTGRVVISERINDSDLGGRGVLGGPNTLVQAIIDVISDETSPQRLTANLWIKDSCGEVVYHRELPITLSFKREEGEIESASGQCILNLILESKESYGFYVEITPDAPVDWTFLKVKQGVRTLKSTEVIHIKPSAN